MSEVIEERIGAADHAAGQVPEPSWELKHSLQVTFVEWKLSKCLGKILTILDAAIQDSRQNKATKDLCRSAMNDTMTAIRSHAMPEGYGEAGYKLQPAFEP
jgi:hypothetical protein